jgi:MazG family protein
MEPVLNPAADKLRVEGLGLEPAPGAARAFAKAVGIMARLRGPGGCPWDREQSFDSIRKHTLEEAYEVLDAIERRDWAHLEEELGDLLLQVLFYAQLGSELEAGRFDITGVIETLNRKLIRRHPHVFGEAASAAAGNRAAVDAQVEGSAARVLANWEQIKLAEKAGKDTLENSLLDGVQRAQPALAEAGKLGSKAAKVGFDWPGWRDLLAKVEEETAELVEAVEAKEKQIAFGNDKPRGQEQQKQQIPVGNDSQKSSCQADVESELGDLLFTVVNLGRHLGVDAEMALRGTNARFRERFRWMERVAGERELAEHSPEELEALWSEAKVHLAGGKG